MGKNLPPKPASQFLLGSTPTQLEPGLGFLVLRHIRFWKQQCDSSLLVISILWVKSSLHSIHVKLIYLFVLYCGCNRHKYTVTDFLIYLDVSFVFLLSKCDIWNYKALVLSDMIVVSDFEPKQRFQSLWEIPWIIINQTIEYGKPVILTFVWV